MVFLTKIDGYQKHCVTKTKNVTKMRMIIKGVYYNIIILHNIKYNLINLNIII
jgi:uncharacterized protein YqfB (UPF0267 family)